MTMNFEQLEALRPDFEYAESGHDRLVLTVGLRASLYFWRGHTVPLRTALVECIEAYQDKYGAHLVWSMDPETAEPVKLSATPSLSVRLRVEALDEDDSVEIYMSSAIDPKAVGEYRVEALTERGWQQGRISLLTFTLPRVHAFEPAMRADFLSLFRYCVNRLAPFHAHAGLAASSTYDQYEWQPEELDIATRYLGLYIEASFIDQASAARGFKSVDWMTYIGGVLAMRTGGIDRLKEQFEREAIAVESVAGGVLVASGEAPELGPVGVEVPARLVRINHVLRPLRAGNITSMAFGTFWAELQFNRCTSDLWLRRLDAPGIWPPTTFDGLPKHPLGRPPKTALSLQSGDVCKVHGRYGITDAPHVEDDADLMPVVVLMPGDVAPSDLQLGAHGEPMQCVAGTWELLAEL